MTVASRFSLRRPSLSIGSDSVTPLPDAVPNEKRRRGSFVSDAAQMVRRMSAEMVPDDKKRHRRRHRSSGRSNRDDTPPAAGAPPEEASRQSRRSRRASFTEAMMSLPGANKVRVRRRKRSSTKEGEEEQPSPVLEAALEQTVRDSLYSDGGGLSPLVEAARDVPAKQETEDTHYSAEEVPIPLVTVARDMAAAQATDNNRRGDDAYGRIKLHVRGDGLVAAWWEARGTGDDRLVGVAANSSGVAAAAAAASAVAAAGSLRKGPVRDNSDAHEATAEAVLLPSMQSGSTRTVGAAMGEATEHYDALLAWMASRKLGSADVLRLLATGVAEMAPALPADRYPVEAEDEATKTGDEVNGMVAVGEEEGVDEETRVAAAVEELRAARASLRARKRAEKSSVRSADSSKGFCREADAWSDERAGWEGSGCDAVTPTPDRRRRGRDADLLEEQQMQYEHVAQMGEDDWEAPLARSISTFVPSSGFRHSEESPRVNQRHERQGRRQAEQAHRHRHQQEHHGHDGERRPHRHEHRQEHGRHRGQREGRGPGRERVRV
jgi:hypothetical protein